MADSRTENRKYTNKMRLGDLTVSENKEVCKGEKKHNDRDMSKGHRS